MQTNLYEIKSEEKHISLVSSRTVRLVRQHEILYLQSDNCYTNIYLIDNSSFMMCKTLKNYEEELSSRLFFRCHKSFLVNVYFIKEIIKRNGEQLVLTTGTIIPISRRKSIEMRKILFYFGN